LLHTSLSKRASVCYCSLLRSCSLYNQAMHDLNTLLGVMTEYFGGVLVLVLTFLCWHFDRRGKANVTTKASYVALTCLILLVMALPLMGA
jgi:hypothetical protein